MSRTVNCVKLHAELPALSAQPYPGDLGQRIYDTISAQAWNQWLERQTMLINEYRLSMIDPQARQFLTEQMEAFLFGDGGEAPSGYVPPPQD